MAVTKIVVRKTPEAAELWYFGSDYRAGQMLAERIPFAQLLCHRTPQQALESLVKMGGGLSRHWKLPVEREGW